MMAAEEALPAVQPRQDWMRQHIEALFEAARAEDPQLRFEIRCIHPWRKGQSNRAIVNAATFDLSDDGITAGIQWAVKLNTLEDFNVYIGANPRRRDVMGEAKATDVEPLFQWQFVDADNSEAVSRLYANDRLRHNMMVATGMTPHLRCHCYWKLEEPTRNPEAWADVQRHLQRAFATDAVHDTPRILRLAGSISYPSESKEAKGYRTEIVQIAVHEERPAVAPESLLAIPAPEAPASTPTATSGLHLGTGGHIEPMALIDAIRRQENRHNSARDLIAHLVGIGQPDWAIVTLLEELLRDRSDGGTLAEVPALIQGARQKFNKPEPILGAIGATGPELPAGNAVPEAATAYLNDPPPRQWIVEHWIVQGAVNSLYGDGGIGKTLLAQQIGLCVASGVPFLGIETKQFPVLAVLCEDDRDEIHRRQYYMTGALKLGFNPGLQQCFLWSRVGADNFLLAYNAGRPMLTPFYQQVVDYLRSMGAGHKLVILDTLADTFGGNEIERVSANYFIKTTLGSIALATNSTILLLAHPSRAGMESGDMLSGSTAWHNAVRSRMALQWIKGDDGKPDPDMIDQRLLTRPKANYAQANAELLIEYKDGAFFPVQTSKSVVDQQGIRQTVKDEVARMAARGTPLGLSPRSAQPAQRHRFKRYGKRILPVDVMTAIEELIDRKAIEVRQQKGKPWGLYPIETGD